MAKIKTKSNQGGGMNEKQYINLISEGPTVSEAAKNIILGYPIMELKTPNEDYVKFQTIDDTQRWVKKKHIKTIDK